MTNTVVLLWQFYTGWNFECYGVNSLSQFIKVFIWLMLVKNGIADSHRSPEVDVLIPLFEQGEIRAKYRRVKKPVLSIYVHRAFCEWCAGNEVSV